jgi:osmotically-inducible protein OsmY
LLGGFVESDQLRKDIVAAVETVDGVLKVHDRIAVQP